MAKKTVTETPVGRNDLSGFGDNVVKLTDQTTGEVVAYIGIQQGQELIHFPKPITPEQVDAVNELVQKKKFNKYISNERFDKAQEFADRKYG